jgi:hypothetical protein
LITGIRHAPCKRLDTPGKFPGRKVSELRHDENSGMILAGSHQLTVDPREVADVVRANHAIRSSRELKLLEVALSAHVRLDDGEYVESRRPQGLNPV